MNTLHQPIHQKTSKKILKTKLPKNHIKRKITFLLSLFYFTIIAIKYSNNE